MDTHKHGNKEKLPINSFSLFTCKIQISLLETKPKYKSRLHCIDINADLCIYNYTKNYPIPDCGGGALYFYV